MWTESQIALFLINFDRRDFFLHLVAFLDFRSIETKFNQSHNIGKISKKINGKRRNSLADGNRLKGIKYPSAVFFFPGSLGWIFDRSLLFIPLSALFSPAVRFWCRFDWKTFILICCATASWRIHIRHVYTCYYPVKLTFMDALLSTVRTSVLLSISLGCRPKINGCSRQETSRRH